nr:DegT/DnrJ/EryC1/StrS family aminotransferase [uncultured Cohaesibacter sp.]
MMADNQSQNLAANEQVVVGETFLPANQSPASSSEGSFPDAGAESARTLLSIHFQGAQVHYGSGWSSTLYSALLAVNVEPGDEVIIPALAPAGVAHAVLLARATPVLVDVTADTRLLAPEGVMNALTEKTKCVIISHLYGQVYQYEALHDQLKQRGIAFIEEGSDAFLALGQMNQPASHCDLLVGCLSGRRDIEGEIPAFIISRQQPLNARLSYWTAQGDIAERLFRNDPSIAEEAPYLDLISTLSETQNGFFQQQILDEYNLQSLIEKQIGFYDDAFADLDLDILPKNENQTRLTRGYQICLQPQRSSQLFEILYRKGFKVYQTYRNLAQLSFFMRQESAAFTPNSTHWGAGAFTLPTGEDLSRREQRKLVEAINSFCRQD